MTLRDEKERPLISSEPTLIESCSLTEVAIKQRVAEILVNTGAFQVNFEKPYTFSGRLRLESPMKVVIEKVVQDSNAFKVLTDSLVASVEANNIKKCTICGVITGGKILGKELAKMLDWPFITRMGRNKSSEKMKQVEGEVRRGSRVLVVEDAVTTGENAFSAIQDLKNKGAIVSDLIGAFSYDFESTFERCRKEDIKPYFLTNFETLLNIAGQLSVITPQESQRLFSWRENAAGLLGSGIFHS